MKTSSVLFVFHDQTANIYINGLPWGMFDEKTGVFQKHKVNGADGLPKETGIQTLGACYTGSRVFESEEEVFTKMSKAVNIAFGSKNT